MGLRKLFKLKGWEPDLDRTPPSKDEWPDHIVTLNARKFDKFIGKYPLVVVDFWAQWCGPCKTMAPRIRQLSKRYRCKVAFGKINIDNYQAVAKRYHVMGIPNLIFFSYGEKITKMVGVRPLNDIQDKIDELLMKFEQK